MPCIRTTSKAAVKDYLAKGKSEGADDILAKHAGDYWYHRYYNSMRRLNLHYKLNGKKQPVLRVGGIDVIHVAHVLGDALAHVHPELKAGAKKMDQLIDAYYKDHSDENAKKFFLNMVRELVPQAFPGVEVLDVTSAWNKDPDGENEGMKRHPGQPINKISPNQDADITKACYSATKAPKEAAKEIDAKYMGGNEGRKKAEGHEGWDDWEEVEGLEDAIEGIENLAYELRHCIRGAKTHCKDWKALALYIKGLASNLDDAAELMAYKRDGEDESKKKNPGKEFSSTAEGNGDGWDKAVVKELVKKYKFRPGWAETCVAGNWKGLVSKYLNDGKSPEECAKAINDSGANA